ncbi:MAG: hypothetical protein ABSG63_14210 [Spirochaetia bacterium]|jgi:hypothetical protein
MSNHAQGGNDIGVGAQGSLVRKNIERTAAGGMTVRELSPQAEIPAHQVPGAPASFPGGHRSKVTGEQRPASSADPRGRR